MIGQYLEDTASQLNRQLTGQPSGKRYQIKALLGKQRGRRTFLAEEITTQTQVVLKLILFGPDFTWEDLKLFEREAETLKALDHPAIPKYLDFFETETLLGKGFVLVQTYIAAPSLAQHVSSGRRFSEADLQEISGSILTILEYLHRQCPPVVHRDIKPSNLLLTDRTAHSCGRLYLIDFGSVQVAQHGGTMTVVGTYGYMPPEQFGGRATPASDLYSLGATLVYLASGRHPSDFAESRLDRAIAAHLNLSERLTDWITQLVQSDVQDRTATAAIAINQLNHMSISSAASDFSSDSRPNSQSLPTVRLKTADLAEREVRPYLPYLPLASGSFKVYSSAQALSIRFYQHRIKEMLQVRSPIPQSEKSTVWNNAGATLLLLAVFVLTVLAFCFLNPPLAFTLSLVIVLSGAMILFSAQSDSGDYPGTAALDLSRSSDGSTLLTVQVLHVSANRRTGEAISTYCGTQFFCFPVESVRLISFSDPLSFSTCAATFTFSQRPASSPSRLSITGSKPEIRELLDCIQQWDSSIVVSYS